MILSRRDLFKLISAAAVVAVVPPLVLAEAPKPITWRKHFERRLDHVYLVGFQDHPARLEQHACIAASRQMILALRDEDLDNLGFVRRDPMRNVHQLEMLASREKLEALDAGIVRLMAEYVKTPDAERLPDGEFSHLEEYALKRLS